MTLNFSQARSILDSHLGTGISHRKEGEISYSCPFCHHYKPKLQVNLLTQKWHCWVCDTKGQALGILLRKSNASTSLIQKLKEIYGDIGRSATKNNDRELVGLPEHYKPLYIKQNTPDYKNALHYVINERGLTPMDVLRYEIGYCEEGPYAGMIVIPSYDEDNNLNYYVGRSFYPNAAVKHKNPPVTKDVIGFENQINWNEPIVVVEGGFDAISTKRNAIPLFGRKILSNLRSKIITNKVAKLYLCLDTDAFKQSVKEIEYFMNNNVEVYLVSLLGKDPNAIGYESTVKALDAAKRMDFFDLIQFKMML
jgi:DNA primase